MTTRLLLMGSLVFLLLAGGSSGALCGEPQGRVLQATYVHEAENEDLVRTVVGIEIENSGAVPLESVRLVIGTPSANLVEFTARDAARELACHIVEQSGSTNIEFETAVIEPGSRYSITLSYVVAGSARRINDAVELRCQNAIIHWHGLGRETFRYKVKIPEGMNLVLTAPPGGRVREEDGVSYALLTSAHPLAQLRVRYSTVTPVLTTYHWVYIVFAAVAIGLGALLYLSRAWHYMLPRRRRP